MNMWTNEVLLGRIYENSENIFYNQNYIINKPLMFLIMRRIKGHQNTNQDTRLIFPFYISSTSFTTNVQLGDEAYTDDIILDNGSTVVYTPESSKDAINNYGGYYLPYTRDTTKALKSNYVADKQLTKPGWVNAIFVFVYINRNNQMTVMNQISFNQYATGEIVGKYTADSFPEFYSSSLDYFRAFLEWVFVIMTPYFLQKIIKHIMIRVFKKYKEIFESQDRLLKSNSIIFRLLEWSKQSLLQQSWAHVWMKLTFWFVRFLIKGFYFFLLSVYQYSTSRVSKLARISSMIITLWLISSWIYIVTENSREIDENGDSIIPNIQETMHLIKNNYDTYSILWSVNILLLFLILVSHFTFSSSLSMFYEVIRRWSFDAIFFILMFLNIILVVSLIFNILFGISDENYKTLSDSMLSVFLVSIGERSALNTVTFNEYLRDFVAAILMVFTVLLLNMFVAIIGSHYFEYYLEQGSSDLSSLKLFVNAVLGNPKKYEDKEGQIWIVKFKNKMFRFLHKWVNNVIEEDVKEDFGNTQGCKTWIKTMHAAGSDVLWFASDRILNMIKEEMVDDFSFMIQNSEHNWVNTHFWVSMIDRYVSKLLSPDYFISLLNWDNNVSELEQERRVNLDENDHSNEEGVSYPNNNNYDFISKYYYYSIYIFLFSWYTCFVLNIIIRRESKALEKG